MSQPTNLPGREEIVQIAKDAVTRWFHKQWPNGVLRSQRWHLRHFEHGGVYDDWEGMIHKYSRRAGSMVSVCGSILGQPAAHDASYIWAAVSCPACLEHRPETKLLNVITQHLDGLTADQRAEAEARVDALMQELRAKWAAR